MSNYSTAVFISPEGKEFEVNVSTGLQNWLHDKEDNQDYIYMAWNDVLKAVVKESLEKPELKCLIGELQLLAKHEDEEGDLDA